MNERPHEKIDESIAELILWSSGWFLGVGASHGVGMPVSLVVFVFLAARPALAAYRKRRGTR